jgi:DNA polymerase I
MTTLQLPKKFERRRINARALGAECDSCPLKDRKPVPPKWTRNPKLVILGEAPESTAAFTGEPFSGKLATRMRKDVAQAGIAEPELHQSYAVLCAPLQNMRPGDWSQAVRCCKPRLVQELREVAQAGCSTVLSFGEYAFRVITHKSSALTHWVGYPMAGVNGFADYTVLPNYHPAFAYLHKAALTPVFQEFIRRAVLLARGDFPAWTWPNMVVDPGLAMQMTLAGILQSGEPVGVDIETLGTDPSTSRISCIGVSTKYLAASVPWHGWTSRKFGEVAGLPKDATERALLRDILASDAPKVMHNGQHDILGLQAQGLPVRNFTFDTMLAHAAAFQGMPHDLAFVASQFFRIPKWKAEFKVTSDAKGLDAFIERDARDLRTYNCRDAYATRLLYEPLDQVFSTLYPAARAIFDGPTGYMKLQDIGMRMRQRGWLTSPEIREGHRQELEPAIAALEAQLRTFAKALGMEDFNPSSPKDLHDLFIDILGAPVLARSALTRKPSFGREALHKYTLEHDPRVSLLAKTLLEYRKRNKLLTAYVRGLPVDDKYICHPTANVHGAVTGRWSFSDPSLQVIPKPVYATGEDGKPYVKHRGMRDIFIARPGMWIVAADYSQAELRILAIQSSAKLMLLWYAEDKNVHDMNAISIFGKDFTKNQRTLAKNYIFGKMYGAEDETVWKLLRQSVPSLTLDMVQYISKQWQSTHPEVFVHQAKVVSQAMKHRYVEEPLSGRRRYYFDEVSPTEVMNFPIQSCGAAVINRAIVEVDQQLDWPKEGILAQIHDDLTVEVDDPIKGYRILKQAMERPFELFGKLWHIPVDISVGKNWGDMHEVKSIADVEKVMHQLQAKT